MTTPDSTSPEHRLKKSVAEHFGKNPFFILSVSGGPDSMALLYLFHKLKLKALVVHVNYQKRDNDSDLDQELVEQMAFQWGFESCSVRLNPEDAGSENFQNWARKQRYQIFGDLREAHQADAIVTAHHQDDQVETILHKLFRGSAPEAWQGMAEWDGNIYRPLLKISKREILDFCEAEAVPYRTDVSNLKSEYARNVIRHDLSGKLDAYFPGWKQNLLALREQGERFEASMDVIAAQVSSKNNINLKKFAKLPETLKAAVLKKVIDDLDANISYSKGELVELTKIEELQTGKSIEVGPMIFTKNRDEISIHPKQKKETVSEKITKETAVKGTLVENRFLIKKENSASGDLYLDFGKMQWPLTVRKWKSGDRFKPLGFSGTQKISDHLTNRKISAYLKEKALLLCGSDGTIYAIIYPEPARNSETGAIAELAKCEDKTTTFLTITIK